MRLALKGALAFLAVYALALGAAAMWVESQLNAIATTMVEDTARLIGSEVARTISGSALEQLQQADVATRQRLDTLVADLTQQSSVVAAVVVVNAEGEVVASDDTSVGHRLALPQVVFSATPRVQTSRLVSDAGDYYVFVPLMEGEDLVGYLRLSLKSQRIGRLYHRGRRQLLLVAASGFAAVVLFGVLLHYQLVRRTRALAGALEGAVRGEPAPAGTGGDEFAQALTVARQVGRELTTAREERSQAQRRFGALLRAMNVGVLLVGPERQLEFANPSARELLGCATLADAERCWEQIKPQVAAALDERRDAGAQIDVALPGDAAQRLRFEMYPVDDEGHTGFLVLVKSHEMIELVEKELGFAFQMRGLARFYTAFAHDLKTPLQAMTMNLELLKQTVLRATADGAAAARDRQLRYADVLRNELSQLDRQLRALLNHVAPPSDAAQRVDLRELILDIETLLRPQAQRQRVTLTTQVPERNVILMARRDRLRQAILNLAVNALEAMPTGGRLEVALAVRPDGCAQVSVCDTGPGIEPEILKQAYDRQFTTKPQGTGVGLYVVRSVVEAHGGSVHVDSPVGGGAQFRLEFPATAGIS